MVETQHWMKNQVLSLERGLERCISSKTEATIHPCGLGSWPAALSSLLSEEISSLDPHPFPGSLSLEVPSHPPFALRIQQ
jgi:hypothetical protein